MDKSAFACAMQNSRAAARSAGFACYTVMIWACLSSCASIASLAQTVPLVNPAAVARYNFTSQVTSIAFRPNATDLAVGLYGVKEGKAVVCQSWKNKLTRDRTADTMPTPCFCVSYSSDGSELAWCSWTPGRQIRVATDKSEARSIDCGKIRVTAVAFDPSMNTSLASVSTDGCVRIWNVITRRLLRALPTACGRGISVAFSPDGRHLAAAFQNGCVTMWATANLDKEPIGLDAHSARMNAIAFSPDSRWLATAGADKQVVLWDSVSGRKLHVLDQQHLDPVACLAFSPDGKYLATGDRSGKVVFWSMDTFLPLVCFFPHRQPVYGLAISSDGEWIATGSQDRNVNFFSTRALGYRHGTVRLTGVAEKIGVSLDGQAATFDEKRELIVAAGIHHITVTTEDASNSKTYTVSVEPEAVTTLVVDVRSAFGKLYIASAQPSDVVATNGATTARGAANETIGGLPPGSYMVRVSPRDGAYMPETHSVVVKAGDTTKLTVVVHRAFGDPSPPSDRSAIKQVRVNPRDGAEMIWIPPATFMMGRSSAERDAKPPHPVDLGGYWIYRCPVTVAQYRRFCDASVGTNREHKMPAAPKWGWKDNHPMVLVSWEDAADYSRWAFGSGDRVYLPTEAQYERAMQGPEGNLYPWGDEFSSDQCVNSVRPNRPNGTQPVGSRAENGFGLLDIAGNVSEWCLDFYDRDYYRKSPAVDPVGPDTGNRRVVRGGAWDSSNAKAFRSDYRGKMAPDARTDKIGFRCATG